MGIADTMSYISLCNRVFDKLIWCTIGPKSFLFGTAQFSLWASGAVNYDYIITNSINSLIIGSHARVFDKLIWRTIGPKNFLFGTAQFSLWANGTVNYDYIVTNSINSFVNWLKMYSQWRTH